MIRRPESPSTSKGAKVEADSLRLGIALLVGCERDIIFTTSDSKIHGTTWITRTVQAGLHAMASGSLLFGLGALLTGERARSLGRLVWPHVPGGGHHEQRKRAAHLCNFCCEPRSFFLCLLVSTCVWCFCFRTCRESGRGHHCTAPRRQEGCRANSTTRDRHHDAARG